METFAKLFERFLVFVYHCFDRIVIQGYLPLLTRPEHIVHFFRDVHGLYPITPQILAKEMHEDRKSTRLNSSHPSISYAVFCLKKKKTRHTLQKSLLVLGTSLPTTRDN